jgi:hypothetical protein
MTVREKYQRQAQKDYNRCLRFSTAFCVTDSTASPGYNVEQSKSSTSKDDEADSFSVAAKSGRSKLTLNQSSNAEASMSALDMGRGSDTACRRGPTGRLQGRLGAPRASASDKRRFRLADEEIGIVAAEGEEAGDLEGVDDE